MGGRLVLIGSGETAPTMVRLHRRVLAEAGDGPAVLLDTPFGFQVNADDLVEKTLGYFAESVGRTVSLASWRRAAAPTVERERCLALLHDAAWAFAGPGSPSYALRQWRETPVPAALADVALRGGTVCLGSAAAVLAGTHAIPVYEIYKAGADPYWLEGVDLLGALVGVSAAVIPHYDNNEGGHYDTRFCYLGEQRLEFLESALPAGTGVLGVDEHTAVVFDLDAGTARVSGSGVLTARAGGVSHRFADGAVLAVAELAALLRGDLGSLDGELAPASAATSTPGAASADGPDGGDGGSGVVPHAQVVSLRSVAADAKAAFDAALAARDVDSAVAAVLDLEQALVDWSADTQQGDDDRARRVLRAMIVRLGEVARTGARDPRDVVGPYLAVLMEVRDGARARRDFATSDLVRDRLAEVGVEVRDTPDGSVWVLGGE
ncbi:MAG: hypothetical protein R2737_05570 [Candidatus Nanopelagicales bacterium]